MKIRQAQTHDGPVIEDLHRRAFSASQHGYNGEAELVGALHADGDVVCSLVAEGDEGITGHIMFSRMSVVADGQPIPAASLAPISVLPDVQRSGIGTALTWAGLGQLRAERFQISFVLGDSEYYGRFGYRPELASMYQSPYAGPHFMAVHLDSRLRLPHKGKAEFAPAFLAMG